MEIFGLSDNGEFVIKNHNILHNKSFKIIFRRDRGGIADPQARKKVFAYKEFAYIFYMADPSSYTIVNGLSDEDRHKYAVKASGLPTSYKSDEVVEQAISFYRQECITTEVEIVINMASVLRKSYSLIKLLDKKIEWLVNLAKTDDDVDIEKIINLQNKVLDLSTQVPNQIESFDKAIEKLKIKAEASVKMRGTNESIPISADPEQSY